MGRAKERNGAGPAEAPEAADDAVGRAEAEMARMLREAQETVEMLHARETRRTAVPDGWEMVPLERRVPKEKITLRLDGDVLDFFRATGTGWQTRLNAVLRLFMQAREARPRAAEISPPAGGPAMTVPAGETMRESCGMRRCFTALVAAVLTGAGGVAGAAPHYSFTHAGLARGPGWKGRSGRST